MYPVMIDLHIHKEQSMQGRFHVNVLLTSLLKVVTKAYYKFDSKGEKTWDEEEWFSGFFFFFFSFSCKGAR